LLSAAHVTVDVHVPVPLVIVYNVMAFVHTPLAVYTGAVDALVVLATVNVPWYGAIPGAPVKVTVGSIFWAPVVWLRVALL